MSRQHLDESDLRNIINWCVTRALHLANSGDYQRAQLILRGVDSFISIFCCACIWPSNGRCSEWLRDVLYSLHYSIDSSRIDAADVDRHLIRLSDFCRLNDFNSGAIHSILFEWKLPDKEFWDLKY